MLRNISIPHNTIESWFINIHGVQSIIPLPPSQQSGHLVVDSADPPHDDHPGDGQQYPGLPRSQPHHLLSSIFQVPVTLSLFAEYPPITEPSNSLDNHHHISTVSDEIIEHNNNKKVINDENLISNNQKIRQNNGTDIYRSNDDIVITKEIIHENISSDTAHKKSSYRGKLKLIKDANSAISEMKNFLAKKSVTVDKTDIIEDDFAEPDADKDDKIATYSRRNNGSPQPPPAPPVSAVWQAVKILSEKTGLVTSDEGFINIKPLINMTVNSLGLFDDANDEKDKPFDPNDTKTVLKSIFQIWNPRVSNNVLP